MKVSKLMEILKNLPPQKQIEIEVSFKDEIYITPILAIYVDSTADQKNIRKIFLSNGESKKQLIKINDKRLEK